MTMIETLKLGQKHGQQETLKDINLRVNTGDVFALIGPTGAGKTSLLRLLNLLDKPAEGSISFDGKDVSRPDSHHLEIRRRMSFVQQKPVVFDMSVFDNVACGLKWRHEGSATIKQRVEDVLELVDLTEYKNRNARTLSGGEAQRVAIARALVTKPEVLLLDEPTANLDPNSVNKIEAVLAHTITEQKITVVMATHDMSQGQYLANKIGVLMNGRLLQAGSPDEIFSSPVSREVAEFVGIENILDGEITHKDGNLATINIRGNIIQAVSGYAIGDRVYALIRPEDIILNLVQDKTSARNTFHGRIVKAIRIGPLIHIKTDCGFPLLVVITRRSAQELGLIAGKEIYASFKATAVHIIKR
ncbi:MAG: ABC transporter ATP-binding protein [Dehalococcoidia bacterium]|nr:MAG: ABC transporter ATP-binding protein [Dehalococcoidia bacterium]